MAGYEHFSHPHMLSFDNKVSLEGGPFTCSGCNFPCTDTPIYSCLDCKFFLHEQCFDASRSLIHPLHPEHPLSLFHFPTYTSHSFLCNLCNKHGSGFCFCCSTCEFDLHVHCAYNNDLNPKLETSPPPNKVQIKAHPNHLLRYLPKPPYMGGLCSCDVCGTDCDTYDPLYHCDICSYDAHVGCVNLQKTVKREDHEHELSLLYVNPYTSYICDVCRRKITNNNCMYLCEAGCDYGIHVKCVSGC